jgi:hypothetical protein
MDFKTEGTMEPTEAVTPAGAIARLVEGVINPVCAVAVAGSSVRDRVRAMEPSEAVTVALARATCGLGVRAFDWSAYAVSQIWSKDFVGWTADAEAVTVAGRRMFSNWKEERALATPVTVAAARVIAGLGS